MKSTPLSIVIVGAGPVGTLLSIFLARRGFHVEVFEQRQDMRIHPAAAGRSINLALANRGLYPLEQVGLLSRVRDIMIPMRGRMVHDGKVHFQPYGQREHEVIYSISRSQLNKLLLDAAEETGKVRFHFGEKIAQTNLKTAKLQTISYTTGDLHTYTFEHLFAADGIHSCMRPYVLHEQCIEDQFDTLDHGYKELRMPAAPSGQHAMEPGALHIWPRGEFMLIALANLDGSFTMTLFMPLTGPHSFASLTTEAKLHDLFQVHFPDAMPLLPALTEEFAKNPVGHLGTVRCKPWHYKQRVLLIGDAAHGIVPFHGQGMNCGFEDCAALDAILAESSEWETVFTRFEAERKPNADAIATLALENYQEMRAGVRDPRFQLKKQIAFRLEQLYPHTFIPRYSMVMFHRLPYADAQRRGRIQEEILEACSLPIQHVEQLDIALAAKLIQEKLSPLPSHI